MSGSSAVAKTKYMPLTKFVQSCIPYFAVGILLASFLTISAPSALALHEVKIPLILFHHVRPITPSMDDAARGLSVDSHVFEDQLKILVKNMYRTASLDELALSLQSGKTLPPYSLILTFDDGYDDLYTYAYPLLKKYHYTGVAFIPTAKIGTKGYVTWDQLREMEDSGVINSQSHTLTHPVLTELTAKKMLTEVLQSKSILEKELNKKIGFFCYPYGKYSPEVIEAVKSTGYSAAFTTHFEVNHSSEKLFELGRVRISTADFGLKLERKLLTFLH